MAYNLSPRASQLLRKLSAADFYAQDLKLFLDTHPDDTRALELYREAVKQADACRCAFENEFYPLRASSAGTDCNWDWLSGQWIL
ncbi:MAG: spore coat protein CotJB [Ruminiclostridium sp.]|nr:spore coat protein CotJB [Ruminiclostridium sp.]